MILLYDHIDLRVSDLAKARPFYEALLPALGFTRKTEIPNWLNYAAAAPESGSAKFLGVTKFPGLRSEKYLTPPARPWSAHHKRGDHLCSE